MFVKTQPPCIDNILVNNPEHVKISGNLISDISDNLSQFCIIKSVQDKTKPMNFHKTKICDQSRFSTQLTGITFSPVQLMLLIWKFSSLATSSTKLLTNTACTCENAVIPLRQSIFQNLTKGVRTSVKVKNRLYLSGDDAKYKLYRNKICSLKCKKQLLFFLSTSTPTQTI